MESQTSRSALKTVAGIPLALIAWALIYTLAHAALYLLDMFRGLENDWLQGIFREWFTPGVGGYAAMYVVNKYLEGANMKWVGILFCAPLVIFFIGLPIYIIVFHSADFVFSWKEQILQWGMAVATCAGAFVAYQSIESDI